MLNFWFAAGGLGIAVALVVAAVVVRGGISVTVPAGMKEWLAEYLWSILLVFVGAAVFYWGLYTPELRLSQVGEWSWNHWLSLPAFCGIVLALIKLNEESLEGLAGMLRFGTLLAVFLLFFGIPAGLWVAEGLGITTFPRASCKAFSPDETRSCVLTEDWSYPVTVDRPTKAGQYRFCIFVPGGGDDRIEWKKVGPNTRLYRSKKDMLPIRYRLVPGTCPQML